MKPFAGPCKYQSFFFDLAIPSFSVTKTSSGIALKARLCALISCIGTAPSPTGLAQSCQSRPAWTPCWFFFQLISAGTLSWGCTSQISRSDPSLVTWLIVFVDFGHVQRRLSHGQSIISSERLIAPSTPAIACQITRRYFSSVANVNLLYLNRPSWAMKVVTFLESSCNSILMKPQRRSSLENTVLPFNSSVTSSTVGMSSFIRTIATLAQRMSSQSLILSKGFGATTTGLAHLVGPTTPSLMPSFSSPYILAVTLSRSTNGTFLNFWAWGRTFESTCNFNF